MADIYLLKLETGALHDWVPSVGRLLPVSR